MLFAQRRDNPFLIILDKVRLALVYSLSTLSSRFGADGSPTSFTFEMWIGPSRVTIAPFGLSCDLLQRLFDQAHALDQNLLFLRQHLQHLPRRSPMVPGDDFDFISFFHVKLARGS